MNIILGQELDKGSYPDALGDAEATLGNVVVGPSGLTGILETRLGLAKSRPHEAVRIGHYLKIMREVDDGARFYSRSLEADAWSTAKTVIGWRDELRISGWNGKAPVEASKRLTTIGEIEKRFQNDLIEGMGDRVQALLTALNPADKLDIKKIQIVESLKSWPPCWKRVFDCLEKCNVQVTEISPEFPTNQGDIGFLQQALEKETPLTNNLTGDGSLCVVTGPTEWEACEAIASFLEANQQSDGKTLIIRGGGSNLLDYTLRRHNLPCLGYDSKSRWRTALQVLPLVLANYWDPFDAQRLLEFLSLPKAPISRVVRSFFAGAIREHPGINGPKWNIAFEKALSIENPKERDDFKSELDFWFGNKNRYKPDCGMPVKMIVKVCNRLSEWAGEQGDADNDDILRKSAAIFKNVKEVVEASNEDPVTEPQLNRILDSVVGEGLEGSNSAPEAVPWHVVDTPGQVWGHADSIIWWNFTSNGTDPLHAPWTPDEATSLSSLAVDLKPTRDRRLQEAGYWRNAVRWARKRVVLVAPTSIAGKEVNFHPFWDEIRYLLDTKNKNTQALLFDASSLWRKDSVNLMGHDLKRDSVPLRIPPQPQTEWQTPQPVQASSEESPTSMEKLIACPLAWVMEHVLKIEPQKMISLPSGKQMLGTLAHAVFKEIFTKTPLPSPDEAADYAESSFDDLAPKMASPFLLSQATPERDRARAVIASAAKKLAELIGSWNLTVTGLEQDKDRKDFRQNQAFGGRIDLILGKDQYDEVVIDLKWSRMSKNKKDELIEGKSIQLAAYAWLLTTAKTSFPFGAYYMLAQGELLAPNGHFFKPECVVSKVDLKEIWTAAVKAYETRLQELNNKIAKVEGVASKIQTTDTPKKKALCPAIPGQLSIQLEPKCNYCSFVNLCVVIGVTA